MKHFVYKTTNNKNGKIYIGQHSTENIDDGYLGSGVILQKAIEKYGKENFQREIIAWVDTKEDLNHAEEFFIKHYIQKVGKKNMYNVAEIAGGGWNKGIPFSEESKKKISAALKGNENSKGHPSWNKGIHLTEETKRKISDAHKGIHHTEETKKKMSEALKGHESAFKGHKHTEEAKKKISDIHKNRPDQSKSVLCVETNTIYPSVSEACRQTGVDRGSISSACTGRQKTAGGYHWKYIN